MLLETAILFVETTALIFAKNRNPQYENLGAILHYLLRYAFKTYNEKDRWNQSVFYSSSFTVPSTALLVTSNSHVIFRLGALYKSSFHEMFSLSLWIFLPSKFSFFFTFLIVVLDYGLRSGVWIPEREKDFSLPQIVHIAFGSHPASHSMVPGVTSCRVKWSGKASRLRISGAIMCRPLYALMSWTVTTLPSSL
jgi:hypothetical protein